MNEWVLFQIRMNCESAWIMKIHETPWIELEVSSYIRNYFIPKLYFLLRSIGNVKLCYYYIFVKEVWFLVFGSYKSFGLFVLIRSPEINDDGLTSSTMTFWVFFVSWFALRKLFHSWTFFFLFFPPLPFGEKQQHRNTEISCDVHLWTYIYKNL